jgi:hypothetical protein
VLPSSKKIRVGKTVRAQVSGGEWPDDSPPPCLVCLGLKVVAHTSSYSRFFFRLFFLNFFFSHFLNFFWNLNFLIFFEYLNLFFFSHVIKRVLLGFYGIVAVDCLKHEIQRKFKYGENERLSEKFKCFRGIAEIVGPHNVVWTLETNERLRLAKERFVDLEDWASRIQVLLFGFCLFLF